jgi:hypothetical protein
MSSSYACERKETLYWVLGSEKCSKCCVEDIFKRSLNLKKHTFKIWVGVLHGQVQYTSKYGIYQSVICIKFNGLRCAKTQAHVQNVFSPCFKRKVFTIIHYEGIFWNAQQIGCKLLHITWYASHIVSYCHLIQFEQKGFSFCHHLKLQSVWWNQNWRCKFLNLLDTMIQKVLGATVKVLDVMAPQYPGYVYVIMQF